MLLKMDGESCSIYRDYVHARSLDSRHHESRSWVKNLQARIGHEIPEGYRICGENLYAKHTIHYHNLPSYFLGFSVWNDKNVCLGWDETLEWFELLGLSHVPVLYEGAWNEQAIRDVFPETYNGDPCEGFVVRLREPFHYVHFQSSVAKYVEARFREELEQTDDSFKPWYLREVVRNHLREVVRNQSK